MDNSSPSNVLQTAQHKVRNDLHANTSAPYYNVLDLLFIQSAMYFSAGFDEYDSVKTSWPNLTQPQKLSRSIRIHIPYENWQAYLYREHSKFYGGFSGRDSV